MIPLPPGSTLTDTLFPYTTLFRSVRLATTSCFSAPAIRHVRYSPRQSSITSCPEAASLRTAPAASRSEEHTSELQSLMRISYAVFCLKKKNKLDYNTCGIDLLCHYSNLSLNTSLYKSNSSVI